MTKLKNPAVIARWGGIRILIEPDAPQVNIVQTRFFFWWLFCFSFINPISKPFNNINCRYETPI